MNARVNINMDKKCLECGKGGATDSGVCLSCCTKAISGKPMKSAQGRVVAQRMRAAIDRARGVAQP